MTGPASQDTPASKYALDIATDTDRRLVQLMFHDKPGLGNTFKQAFAITEHWHTGNKVMLTCDEATFEKAKKTFADLSERFGKDPLINKQDVKAIAAKYAPAPQQSLTSNFSAANQNSPARRRGGGGTGAAFEPRTESQAKLAQLIDNNAVTFAVGPAGTGKTHVAMKKAVEALVAKKVFTIMLTRPAMESGPRLGFLPGDQNAKMDPYLRPLYDELDKAFGRGAYKKMIADETIQIVPVGFMRGRTFTDAFVIVDEAQNCNKEETKMFLTRLGENSRMVVTGDPNQIDLPNKADSGLMWAASHLQGKPGIGVQEFDGKDVMRSEIVKVIIANLPDVNDATIEAERSGQKPQRKQGAEHKAW